ncbi:MAG: CvpA family protein [Burkholderiales bacterium]|nr:CvpA family protein [Burkholderiales bacterium]
MAALDGVSGLDWTLLAVLTLSVVVGLWRGFVFECLSLAGWVAAWVAAQWGAPQLAPHLPIGSAGSALNLALAFALCFVAALFVWGLAARLIRTLLRATPLSIPDRLLGAAFGALRGLVLLLAVGMVVALTPAAQSHTWHDSQGAHWLDRALQMIRPLLPATAARLLPA